MLITGAASGEVLRASRGWGCLPPPPYLPARRGIAPLCARESEVRTACSHLQLTTLSFVLLGGAPGHMVGWLIRASDGHSGHDEAMALTPHSTLRLRLLTTLDQLGGSAKRAVVLDELDTRFREAWTYEDLLPQNTRQFESKWRNRVSFERQRLVEAGLLDARSDGIWALTESGRRAVRSFDGAKADWRDHEVARRENLWRRLAAEGPTDQANPNSLRTAGVYAGARGIYVDVLHTRSEFTPSGAAVSFLHLGVRYANELSDRGLVYHYPRTDRPGRDRAEITATEAAFALGLPVFVIMLAAESSDARAVRRAFVEDIDSENGTALITFVGEGDELPPPPPFGDEVPFDLLDLSEDDRWARRRSRPHQSRFAFNVMRRYGASCAVCDLSVMTVVEAAHLRPKSKSGSDDERNGLPLCSNHHRMFDAHLWCVQPETLNVVVMSSFTHELLGITRRDIKHLRARPHGDALKDAWKSWSVKQST